MASATLLHASVPVHERGHDALFYGGSSFYTAHAPVRDLFPHNSSPATYTKERMNAPSNHPELRLTRLVTTNPQRSHTNVKGLWTAAPRSAHPAATYERGVDYPRLFQLESPFGANVRDPSGGLSGHGALKPPSEPREPQPSHFAPVASGKATTAAAYAERQSSRLGLNPAPEPVQVRPAPSSLPRPPQDHDAPSGLRTRDAPLGPHAAYRPFDDRTPSDDREAGRGLRVNAGTGLPVTVTGTSAPYLSKRPIDVDRPIRGRSLSEAGDGGRRAFRSMADWITIYLFALVETGRLPQDGALDRLPLWKSMTAFQSTRQLIFRILVATAVPHSAVFLALWYIFRLPISPQTVVYAQDTARTRFRDCLKGSSAYLIEDYMMRVFTAGIMLADKWVNDQTFQLRTWHEITGIPKGVLRNLEAGAMGVLEYNLRVSANEWQMWLGHLSSWHSSLGSDPSMTVDAASLPHAIISSSLKDVVRASSSLESRGTPEPNFLALHFSHMNDLPGSAAPSITSNNPMAPLAPSVPPRPLAHGLPASHARTAFSAPAYMKPWPGQRSAFAVSSF
ncbi:hypothetical protein BC834DRAFT_195519 [Gloeopeniophorella convolvens]|nr:hypothetical protein BC834DRAFT_195519 [Gloeopeniophorella convolvens]